MRAILIIILWLALGAFYMTKKSTCCDNAESTVISGISNDKQSESAAHPEGGASDFHLSDATYNHSESGLDSNVMMKVVAILMSEDLNGKGIEVVGYAYSDETSPEQLAQKRANLLREHPHLRTEKVKVKGIVFDKPYIEEGPFLDYELFALKDEASSGSILVEGKRTYFFLDEIGTDQVLSEEVRAELRKMSRKLSNNFCKVRLISYNDNREKGTELTYYMEEYLIKYGLSPNRIVKVNKDKGDRDDNIVELRILE